MFQRGSRGITIALLAPAVLACFSFSPHEVPFSGRNLRAESLVALQSRPVPAGPLRFAVVGDTHAWYDEAWDAVRLLNGVERLAFVVQVGDFTDLGRGNEYELMGEVFEALEVPWFVVIGNHDLLGNGGAIFDDVFGPRNSDFTYARTRFILLDTNSREYGFGGGVPDLGWLESRLAPTPDHDGVVIFSHIGPWSDDFDPALREAFVSQLGAAGVALSVHGHDHRYAASEEQGVRYFVADAVQNRTLLLVDELVTGGFDVRRVSF
jgi:3',5'-cyclic AMP phosphodiesterase CpdA